MTKTITGIAKDLKRGAAIQVNDSIIFIKGLDYWSEEFLGKKVKATGKLVKVQTTPVVEIPDGMTPQWTNGEILELEDSVFELTDQK